MSDQTEKWINRRKGQDGVLRTLPWISAIGWTAMVAAWYLAASAQPEAETLIERWHGKDVDARWDLQRLHWMFRLAIVSLVAALSGIVLNSRRIRRKKDEFRVNFMVLGSIALLVIGLYFFRVLN